MPDAHKNGDDPTLEVRRICERFDDELKQLPIETYGAVVNVLSQLCEHRLHMIQREARKIQEAKNREAQFSPHKKAN